MRLKILHTVATGLAVGGLLAAAYLWIGPAVERGGAARLPAEAIGLAR